MCPSWKATRDRRHSPKGRASLLREWLRLISSQGGATIRQSQRGNIFASFIRKARNGISAVAGAPDFSREVKAAMDGCLSCKSCVGQCPIKVDVPQFRAKFLEAYHQRYFRPIRDVVLTRLEGIVPHLRHVSGVYNLLISNPVGAGILRILGLVETPKLSQIDLHRELLTRGVATASYEKLSPLNDFEKKRSVVIVQDAFTSHFEPNLVLDFVELLQRLGYRPWLAPYMANGKPLHVHGYLHKFSVVARRNSEMLHGLARSGVALVGVDPSMSLTYRSEYKQALSNKETPTVMLPQEWFAAKDIKWPKGSARQFWLLPHCTERTNAAEAMADWTRVFERFGLKLEVLQSGCCGMAGAYGHIAANRNTSKVIYAMSWQAFVQDPRYRRDLLATGYSCRCQAKLIDNVRLRHPIEALLKASRDVALS